MRTYRALTVFPYGGGGGGMHHWSNDQGCPFPQVRQTPPPPPQPTDTMGYGQQTCGTHPTGMHNCPKFYHRYKNIAVVRICNLSYFGLVISFLTSKSSEFINI